MTPAWEVLAVAVQTGAPDLVVVPATTLATLRRDDDWQIPDTIDRLAGVVSVSRAADEAADRVAARPGQDRMR